AARSSHALRAYSFLDFSKLRKLSTFLASIFPAGNLARPVFAASHIVHSVRQDSRQKRATVFPVYY
ncbi:MAG TPA: hypothetical protein VEP90_05420, partial [Methylomirabilota bacterium]|nr:hypothetical protein [Methylomirabilota bacterium]